MTAAVPGDGRCLLAAQREHEHPRDQRGPDETIRRSRGYGHDRAAVLTAARSHGGQRTTKMTAKLT